MKTFILSLFMFLSAAVWAQENQDGILLFARGTWQANLHWVTGPVVGDSSTLRMDWKRADQTPVEAPGNFTVTLWMPAMGHGSAPTTIQPILDSQGQVVTGAYQVTNVQFIMNGDWQIQVALTVNGKTETESLAIHL